MVGKRIGSLLLVAIAAASIPCPALASKSQVQQVKTFTPRSFVTETSPLKKDKMARNVAVLESRDFARGGAIDPPNQVVSALGLFAINFGVTKAFAAYDVPFPAMLGGCIILFAFLLLADTVKSGMGNDIYEFLFPGATLLAKWLPVFFVPGLAMLPRAPSLGTPLDVRLLLICESTNFCLFLNSHSRSFLSAPFLIQVLKIITTVVVGFFYTLSTTTYAVSLVNKKTGPEIPSVQDVKRAAKKAANKVVAPASAPSKPYLPETLSNLIKASLVTGAVSIAATKKGNEFATPLQTIFLFCSTVAAYVFGARLPSEITTVVHPLVTSTGITLCVIRIVAELTGSTFMNVLSQYKVGSMQWKSTGAGDVFLYMLGPAVVSFALSMYSRRKLMMENLAVVITAMVVSAGGGLFGTAAFVRLLQIGGKNGGRVVRLSCLTRNVTTALAMAVTNMLGGDISIGASVVVMSGIFGATIGRRVLDKMGVKDPIARGLGLGCSAQGLGVAALIPEPDAFPFSAMGMILTAVFATTLVSIPAVKELLINIATG